MMSVETKDILDLALQLPAAEKIRLVDQILSSLDQPDEAIDAQWRQEVEARLKAYEAGQICDISDE